jgi:6-phosphogluconolactonase/glucosamine-6-phosphate isomerase/deaminase
MGDEYVISSQDEESRELSLQERFWDHISNSSFFIFHRDSAVRKFMLKLTTAPITKQVT